MQTIVTIDDDPITLKLLNDQLSQNQFKVLSTTSGKQGIDITKNAQPDLVLLDIQMPEMDGVDVLKELHAAPLTSSVPVIMLTGIKDKKIVVDTMKLGIIDYIVKPYDVSYLITKINAGIRYNRLKKREKETEESENILISHDNHAVIISFKIPLNNKKLISEARTVFTPFFLRQVKNKYLIMDLRILPSFAPKDTEILMVLVNLLKNSQLLIVAGRHYGTIVQFSDIEEQVLTFITFGDLSIYLNKLGKKL